jgi:pSer/pThr/pTyr-binding forkhead associated (FHA) protein
MWKLIIEDEEGKRTIVPLTRDDYTIGRKEGNTIRLTERNVSRTHAALRRKANGNGNGAAHPPPSNIASSNGSNGAGAFFLEDQQSYNGVYVNGLRVANAQDLMHGDLIQIGDYRIVLHDDAAVDHAGAATTIPDDSNATLPNITQPGRASLLMERPNRLVMLAGPTPGAEYPLDRDRLSLGRAEDATISVNHNSVSRLHCEIHALGESRFEIMDKGSSNGVRVNGSDLRRGIIEAGDVIELGDVRFKFVGAGQIFLPGAGESTQFESIGDRQAAAVVRQRSGSSIVPWLLMGAMVSAVVVGFWAYKRQRELLATPAPVAPSADTGEEAALDAAAKMCEENDCEGAHGKVTQVIGDTSPLRNSDRFKLIELRWAEQMLERAKNEQDVNARRAIYGLVEKQPTVDDVHRKMASDKLQELDSMATPPERLPMAARDGGQVGRPTTTTSSEQKAERAARNASTSPDATHSSGAKPPPTTAAATPSTSSATASGANVAQQARDVMLKDPDAAKKILYPRVAAGHATREEISLLKIICKNLHDQECVTRCKTLLGEQ